MKNKISWIFKISFILVLLTTSLFSQSAGEAVTLDKSVKNSGEVYHNTNYKLEMKLPENWVKISSDETKTFAELGKERDDKLNNEAKKQIDNSLNNSIVLFHYLRDEFGTSKNSGLICAVENIPINNVTTKAIILASQLSFKNNYGYEVVTPAKPVKLGGKDFYYIEMKKENNGFTIRQRFYGLKISPSEFLQFALTFANDEDLKLMEESLNTLTFNK